MVVSCVHGMTLRASRTDLRRNKTKRAFTKVPHYTDKVVCGGFSQGGSMTLASCLSYETHKLEALIIASGIALLGKSLLGSRYKNMQDNVPIYIFHGEVDRVIQFQHAMKSFAELVERRGDKVQIFTEPNQGHEITDSEYLKLVELITKHCAN